jgi:zinc transport system permease protein
MQLLQGALASPYVQRALLVGALLGLCCAVLGVFLVLRRFSLIGDGLGHVALGTVGLALFAGLRPLHVSVPLVMVASLGILHLSRWTRMYGDAAIGLVSATGIAAGVMFASLGGGYNVDLFSYLFGSILAVRPAEIYLSAALAAGVLGAVALFYHDLFAISYDGEHARSLGIRVGLANHLLVLCTALTVVLGIRVIGTMLISSLVVFPAVTALQLARGFRMTILLAMLSAVLSVAAGVICSYVYRLPTGASIVMANLALFILAIAGRLLFRR